MFKQFLQDILTMLFFLSKLTLSLAVLELPSPPPCLPLSVFKHFPDYNFIVHFDSSYNHPLILSKMNNNQQVYLFNYHYKTAEKLRPEGYKFINVVFLKNPFMFQEFSVKPYNFIQDDVVVFVTKKIQGDKIWHMEGLNRAAGVFIYETQGKMFHCCYYCGNSTGVLKEAKGNLRELLNDYSNFKGHIFRVAYTNFAPFFTKSVEEDRPWGSEGRLLHHFCKILNFQVELVEFQSFPEKGAWPAMIQAVENNEVDWAVGGISVTLQRGIFTDFTRYIKTQGFSVVYAVYQDTWMAFESVLFVFKWSIWVIITITVISICLIATVANRMFRGRASFFRFMRICLVAIAEQPTCYPIRGFTVKGLFLTWWLTSLSLTTMYKSQLASGLIKPRYNQPNKVDELVEKNFKFHIQNESWSVIKESIEYSLDKIYEKILRRTEKNLDFCDSILALNERKLAMIAEETSLEYNIFNQCPTVTFHHLSNLRLVTENLFANTYHAWPMAMGTPFRIKFSRTISWMESHGLIQYWYKNASVYKLLRGNSRSQASEAASLTIRQMLPPLMILGIGLCVSVVIFAIEVIKK